MSFILRSSKIVSSILRYYRQFPGVRLQNEIPSLHKQNVVLFNCRLTKEFSTPAPKVKESPSLSKYISRLDSSLHVRQKVSLDDVKEFFEVLKVCGSITSSQSLLLVKSCANLSQDENPGERIKFTNEVWFTLEKLGAKFDIRHYNSLLKAYLEHGYRVSPNKFLKDLEAAEIAPDMFTYQRLLKAYCLLGDIQGASNLLEKMKNEDFPINEDIFNSLVYGHCQINDLDSAKGIIILMKDKGINPSSATYSHLMCFHAKNGQIDEIEKILSENADDIVFSDKDLLDVVYVLAENGHFQHIDNILQRVKKGLGYNVYITDVIHRLLHKRLDDVAIKLFSTLKETAIYVKENFMIENVSKSRSCRDIIKFCEKLEQEELVQSAIYDGLRGVLRFRDTSLIINYFKIMNEKQIPVESHYFWPLIIKASKGGNSTLFDVLAKMRQIRAPICQVTHKKIILPNVEFDSHWKQQTEKLAYYFVPENLIASHLLVLFLTNADMKAAKELACSKPINMVSKESVKLLANCLKKSKDVNSFVRILYGLFHDFTIQKSQIDEVLEDPSSEVDVDAEGSLKLNFDNLLNSLFRNILDWCDEDVLQSVLKEMLDIKIGLTSETSDLICKTFDKPEIVDIVKKLTSPDLKPELNENIMSQKNRWYSVRSKLGKELSKAIQANDLETALALWEEFKEEASARDWFRIVGFCVKLDVEKAVEIYKEIASMSGKDLREEKKGLCRLLLRFLAEKEDVETMKKVFEIGRQCDFLVDYDFELLIRTLTERNKLEKAVDLFCEAGTKFNKIMGYNNLASRLIQSQNAESLEKITNAITNLRGEHSSLILLLFQFAALGHVKQVQKVLETQDLNIPMNRLRRECETYLKRNSTTFFETLLAASKSFPGGHRKMLFQYLYYLYILNGDVEKAKSLWLQIESEDNLLYLPLLQEIESFFLSDEKFDPESTKTMRHKENLRNLIHQNSGNKNYDADSFRPITIDSVQLTKTAINFILQGQVEEFSNLFSRYRDSRIHNGVCDYFVNQKQMDTYLKFFKKALTGKSFIYFFFTEEMLKSLLENKTLVEELKDLAFGCKERGLKKPMYVLWECYMFSPECLKEAEELYKNHLFNKGICSFKRLLFLCRYLNNYNALKSVTESELFKSIPSLKAYECYSCLISNYLSAEDLNTALSYLEKAVSDNLGEYISQDVLVRLSTSLKNSGKDFPYEHLLKEKVEKTHEENLQV